MAQMQVYVDKAETAIQEVEEAFMATDLKYNAAREVQNVVVMGLSQHVKHVSIYYFLEYICTSPNVFCHWRPKKTI